MQPAILDDNHPLLRAKPVLRSVPLPPQPEVLRKVLEEYRQPAPDLQNITAWIACDVCLGGAVLQAVNTPLFALRHTVTSIPQAVSLLGLRKLLLLVRAVALRNGFGRGAECERFWDAANAMAHIALMLAERLDLTAREELYTLGLFHDCGMLLMMQQFPDYKTLLMHANNDPARPVTDWEDRRYGLNHTDLGFLISATWYLPPALCHVVAAHHKPFADMVRGRRRVPDEVLGLIAALKTVRHIYSRHRHIMRGDLEELEWARDSHAVLAHLGLSEPDFLAVRDGLLDNLDASSRDAN